MARLITLFICFCYSLAGFAQHTQQKYWILFKDKDTVGYDYQQYLNDKAIENRIMLGLDLYQYSDVPVNSRYIDSVSFYSINIIHSSRWLNAVSAHLTIEQLELIKKKTFVKDVQLINTALKPCWTSVDVKPKYFHEALKQMEAMEFINLDLDGSDVVVGVIDAGFYGTNSVNKMTSHIISESKVIAQKDFIDSTRTNLLTEKATSSDVHGGMVLESIAGYNAYTGFQQGLAPNAKFYLARTENGDREHRGEEDDWIKAMEWMDSKGVRLINTSLGYATKMDDPNDNYMQSQMDGQTARITKAAQLAIDEKGICLVVSAGNEGGNANWRIISAPADAKGVISVGATQFGSIKKIGYSSIGPEHLPYLKPNVAVYSPNGTSFSSPSVVGFVACMLQKAPYLTNKEIKVILEKSALLYPYGNNYVGYGWPQASKVLKLIENPNAEVSSAQAITIKRSKKIKSINFDEKEVIVFHKKNETIVVKQDDVKVVKGALKMKVGKDILRSTIVDGRKVYEITWK